MAVIAIAGYPTKAWADPRVVTAVERYVSAVRRAGGHEAILVPQPLDRVSANQILARFDGLLLMGGGDVDSALYQQERQPETHNISADRDSFEIALIQSAVERETPLLAICRGIQVLNVALGGTLVQHLDRTESIMVKSPLGNTPVIKSKSTHPANFTMRWESSMRTVRPTIIRRWRRSQRISFPWLGLPMAWWKVSSFPADG